jgi:hypothetical protein
MHGVRVRKTNNSSLTYNHEKKRAKAIAQNNRTLEIWDYSTGIVNVELPAFFDREL